MGLFLFSRKILGFLFENKSCLCCGKKTVLIGICNDCIQKNLLNIEFNENERCSVCGKVLNGEANLCLECRKSRMIFNADKIYPIHSYKLYFRNLVYQWKQQKNRNLSPIFADMLEKTINLLGFDLSIPVVSVPPRKNKIKKEGWDQMQDICYFLKHKYNRRIQNLLVREGASEQKKKTKEQRKESASKEYVGSKEIKSLFIKKKIPDEVILIDDVLTTGSTIESCCKILKSYGVSKVTVIILFIVD